MVAKTKSKKLGLQPTAGYLIIDPSTRTKTDSGIYLPDTASEKPQKGVVLAVGPDDVSDSGATKTSPAKVGDTVLYKKWGGNEVKIEGVEYLFAKFEDILAIEG